MCPGQGDLHEQRQGGGAVDGIFGVWESTISPLPHCRESLGDPSNLMPMLGVPSATGPLFWDLMETDSADA